MISGRVREVANGVVRYVRLTVPKVLQPELSSWKLRRRLPGGDRQSGQLHWTGGKHLPHGDLPSLRANLLERDCRESAAEY